MAQQSVSACGAGTEWRNDTETCVCTTPLSLSSSAAGTATGLNDDDDDNGNVISLTGIYHTSHFTWAEDAFEVTVDLLNQGAWGDILPVGTRLEYQLDDSECDETTAVRSYWKYRALAASRDNHRNHQDKNNNHLQGIIGARCSGASVSLARISGLEEVPMLTPASSLGRLSNEEEFPFFSRMVAPANEFGEGMSLWRFFLAGRVCGLYHIVLPNVPFLSSLQEEL